MIRLLVIGQEMHTLSEQGCHKIRNLRKKIHTSEILETLNEKTAGHRPGNSCTVKRCKKARNFRRLTKHLNWHETSWKLGNVQNFRAFLHPRGQSLEHVLGTWMESAQNCAFFMMWNLAKGVWNQAPTFPKWARRDIWGSKANIYGRFWVS